MSKPSAIFTFALLVNLTAVASTGAAADRPGRSVKARGLRGCSSFRLPIARLAAAQAARVG